MDSGYFGCRRIIKKDVTNVCIEVLSLLTVARNKINLNTISHDSAAGLIRKALEKGVIVKEVIVISTLPF